MNQNLFLFTWPDWYFLNIELQKRQRNFGEKFGDDNICVFTEDTITTDTIQEALQWWWLFATKKLIICKGIPEDKALWAKAPSSVMKYFENILWDDSINLSPDILLVFVSIDPDKRLKLYKILSEKAQIKSFPALSDGQVITFLQQKLWDYFSQDLADYLLAYVGNNLFRLECETDKIVTYLTFTKQQSMSSQERDAIIYTPVQTNAFGVLDAIVSWDIKTVWRLIDSSAQAMTARPEFLGMVYRGIKHMILTVDIYNTGITSAKDIAAKIGMHFFPIVKNIKYIKQLQTASPALQDIFHDLLLLDRDIKSGIFPQEWFWAAIKGILYKHIGQQAMQPQI